MAVNEPVPPPAPRFRWPLAWWIVLAGLVLFWGAAAVGAIRLVAARPPDQQQDLRPLVLWIAGMVIILILLALAGREINGRWVGVLIDSRNKLSLSRLQISLWTTLVLSAYLAMAIPRVVASVAAQDAPPPAAATATPAPTATPGAAVTPGAAATPTPAPIVEPLTPANALNITFPGQLILAMGISAASFAGANLIKGDKKSKQFKIEAKATPDGARLRLADVTTEHDEAVKKLDEAVQEEANKKQDLENAKAALGTAADQDTKAKAEERLNLAQTFYDKAVNDKAKANATVAAKKEAQQAAAADLAEIEKSQGLLHKNNDPADARWADLVRGEEIGNYKLVEMAKVQMFFFTLAVIAAYAAAITGTLLKAAELTASGSLAFPDFSLSLNELLGISHATYLSVKTVDHT
jgi:hypothetical protein